MLRLITVLLLYAYLLLDVRFLTITDTELETLRGKSGRGQRQRLIYDGQTGRNCTFRNVELQCHGSVNSFSTRRPGLNHSSLNVGHVVVVVVPR